MAEKVSIFDIMAEPDTSDPTRGSMLESGKVHGDSSIIIATEKQVGQSILNGGQDTEQSVDRIDLAKERMQWQ